MTPSDQTKNMALLLLRNARDPQQSDIRSAVAIAASAVAASTGSSGGIDAEALAREIETALNVWAPDGTELVDQRGHQPWLADARSEIPWDFWRRYELYLEQEKGIPQQVLGRLDSLTDRILENLESPKRRGKWDRRGMVVGQVQSGKTANYTGLICKAVDAGYKLVIVLAGIHNSLRSQTQLRLDEGFLGRDTQQSRVFTQESARLGVGHIIVTERLLAAHSLTTSAEKGDFTQGVANSVATYIGSDPVILVVKKNASVLKNLLKWVRAHLGTVDEAGARTVKRIPLLVLDDEADNASVNTRELELDEAGNFKDTQQLTAINRLIRELLNTFEQSAYVGYTATPFANIFIPPDAKTRDQGEDLFPRSFIINLPAPSNYIGPVQVFGGSGNPGIPVVRKVCDAEALIPSSHRNTLRPASLPGSLKEAIRAFILTCAARRARGQVKVHNSMLVHVTRFNAVQQVVHDLVQQELRELKQRLEYGDGARTPTILDELAQLWERDFVPTTEGTARLIEDCGITPLGWGEVAPHVKDAALKIDLKLVNGYANEALDYFENREQGLSVIAIGGDKLSRGLTLEGLTVSYYLRSTRMYDTLMQMGRWFGYRPGYADLCRLYTPTELVKWYEHITAASEELRAEFDRMASAKMTPEDFGLKVQSHPGGLMVTSAGKMRYGKRVRIAFDRSLIESYLIRVDVPSIIHNHSRTAEFVLGLGPASQPHGDDFHWTGVSGDRVADFLSGLRGHPELPTADPPHLSEFISKKQEHGELTTWTVVLISVNSRAGQSPPFAGLPVGLTIRRPDDKSDDETLRIKNRHIVSEAHEFLDLSPEEYARALEDARAAWRQRKSAKDEPGRPTGPYVRAVRPESRGLLLLYLLDPQEIFGAEPYAPGDARAGGLPVVGFAVSFPGTRHPHDAVEYVVNTVYWNEEFAQDDL